jgi:hypothetical protein
MSKVTRSKLKTYFQTGDQPTENEFIDVFDSTLNLSGSNAITGSLIISGSNVSLSVQGDITSTGDIIASRLNTGQGLNELYDMNQNVKSTNSPTFAGLSITKIAKPSIGEFGGTLTVNEGGEAITFIISNIPTIPGVNNHVISKPSPTLIRCGGVLSNDVIIVNCIDAPLSVVVYGQKTAAAADVEGFYVVLGNESTSNFTAGAATFSCLIL